MEFHSWITIVETYEVQPIGEEEAGLPKILELIEQKIQNLKWNSPKLKVKNASYFIEYTIFANRHTEEIDEMFEFFSSIANIATGSYGLIYMFDTGNEFQVYSISRGKPKEEKDFFLSPVIPTLEDENIL